MKPSVKTGFGILLIALCLTGCNFLSKDPLCQSWKLVSQNGEDLNDTLSNGEFGVAYFRLYKNQQYTYLNFRRYVCGKWSFDKSDSTITAYGFKDGNNLLLKVTRTDGSWMKGEMTLGQTHTPFLFKNNPYFEYKGTDLLSPASNTWRIKPDHKENKDEILKRVTAHIDYMRQYFQIVTDDGRPAFFSGFMHTPINFYSNGIGINTEDNISPVWVKTFYNEDDAKTGHRYIASAIHSINSYPKNTKTYTEGYYIALGEMKDYLLMIKQ